MKIVLIDANHLLSRTFHVPSFQNLSATVNGQKVYTGATFGFLVSLKHIIQLHKEHTDKLFVVWDGGSSIYRKNLSPTYKANRTERTAEFIYQLDLTKKFLHTLGIIQYQFKGIEADDIIGVLTKKARLARYEVLILSGDKDFNQLVSKHVHVLNPKGHNEYRLMTPKTVQEDYGVPPHLFVEWLALTGDSTDNVDGIEGVGKKTATELINGNQTIENIINSDIHYKIKDGEKQPVSKKLQEKINSSKHILKLARQLVEIQCDLDVDLTVDDIKPNFLELKNMFRTFSFNSLLREFNEFVAVFS